MLFDLLTRPVDNARKEKNILFGVLYKLVHKRFEFPNDSKLQNILVIDSLHYDTRGWGQSLYMEAPPERGNFFRLQVYRIEKNLRINYVEG